MLSPPMFNTATIVHRDLVASRSERVVAAGHNHAIVNEETAGKAVGTRKHQRAGSGLREATGAGNDATIG